jgi:hypothetical protein
MPNSGAARGRGFVEVKSFRVFAPTDSDGAGAMRNARTAAPGRFPFCSIRARRTRLAACYAPADRANPARLASRRRADSGCRSAGERRLVSDVSAFFSRRWQAISPGRHGRGTVSGRRRLTPALRPYGSMTRRPADARFAATPRPGMRRTSPDWRDPPFSRVPCSSLGASLQRRPSPRRAARPRRRAPSTRPPRTPPGRAARETRLDRGPGDLESLAHRLRLARNGSRFASPPRSA